MLAMVIPTPFIDTSILCRFNGAVETHVFTEITNPPRAFAFEVVFYRHLWPAALRTEKPPMHFHPFQKEYIQVLTGRICVEQRGHGGVSILTPADGEVCVQPWVHHRLYAVADDLSQAAADEGGEPIRFRLWGQETDKVSRLDTIFFENWYGYQDEILAGKSIDLVQVLTVLVYSFLPSFPVISFNLIQN